MKNIILLLLISNSLIARVYICQNSSENKIYQDKPCSEGQKETLVLFNSRYNNPQNLKYDSNTKKRKVYPAKKAKAKAKAKIANNLKKKKVTKLKSKKKVKVLKKNKKSTKRKLKNKNGKKAHIKTKSEKECLMLGQVLNKLEQNIEKRYNQSDKNNLATELRHYQGLYYNLCQINLE